MRKYPLIVVSICAVVILVLASLSNVVGYQSVKSTVVNDSPLFQTRTQRATNQQQNILTFQYLGKGNGNLLRFPIRDNETESLKRAIEIISKMDDKTFLQFTEKCIQRVRQIDTLSNTNPNAIVQTLQLLRIQSTTIITHFIKRNNQLPTSIPRDTFCIPGSITAWNPGTICHWYPGCILFFLSSIFLTIFFNILDIILSIVDAITSEGSIFCHSPCMSLQVC
jgi:hypothetical protein